MSRKKTHEEFCEELEKINQNITIISKYQRDDLKIKCKCKKDNHIWEATPSNLLQGYGCPKCNGGVSLITKEFEEKLKTINSKIELLEQYINYTTPILCHCHECNNDVYIKPINILHSGKCPSCRKIISNNRKNKLFNRKSQNQQNFIAKKEMFFQYIVKNHSDIEIISDYLGYNKIIRCKCKIDKYVWESTPNNLMRISNHSKCPRCNGRYRTTQTLQEDLDKMNSNIILLGEFIKNNIPIKCRCRLCGHEWNSQPNNLLFGRGCPSCKISNGEANILSYLKKNRIKYETQKSFEGLCGKCRKLRYDFYLPDYNILIEFNGMQHEKPITHFGGENAFKIRQEYDIKKRKYAQDKNIRLLEIWYYNYKNIDMILDQKLNNNITNNEESA